VITFDLNTPISPLAANYTGGAFYGGVNGSPSLNYGIQVANNNTNTAGNDALVFGRASGVDSSYTLTGLLLWKKDDFLAGSGAGDNVTVTSLSYTGLWTSDTTPTALQARFVLQLGTYYIISDNVGLNAGTDPHSLTDLSSVNWYYYNPSATLSLGDIDTDDGPISSPVFSSVTAAGLFLSAQGGDGGTSLNLAFDAFSATGTVSAIPEPASLALLAGAGVIALAGVRRHKRR